MMDNQVVIIVPLYKNLFSYNDLFSLSQCFNILKDYQIIAIKPVSLDISNLQKTYNFNAIISFDDKYFDGISGYNELMLSAFFYERFINYEYMLIYQLDAFVFMDQLKFWCDTNYDYIGAPWLYPSSKTHYLNNLFLSVKTFFYKKYNVLRNGLPNAKQFRNQVGNGGFSLRKTAAFYHALIENKQLAEEYIRRLELEFNEDIFFSIALDRSEKPLQKPDYKLAIKFSIETECKIAFAVNKEKLPFGCHGWDKNLNFWLPFLEKYGYTHSTIT